MNKVVAFKPAHWEWKGEGRSYVRLVLTQYGLDYRASDNVEGQDFMISAFQSMKDFLKTGPLTTFAMPEQVKEDLLKTVN